jgi:endogenous inhibitor of DNA gyrase (YacG/DUF329 family)
MECPICKKEFNEHTGRRPKKFCSDECKVKFWNAFKGRVREVKADKKMAEELAKDAEVTEILKDIEAVNLADIIKKQIADIRAEKIPPHRNNTTIGRKSWQLEQDKRIRELQQKLP